MIEDLVDPQPWWEEADPKRYKAVEVSDEEVTQAVTIMDRLRKSIQKLSSSLSSLTHGITRRRSKSVSGQLPPPPTPSSETVSRQHPPSSSSNIEPPLLMHGKPSFSTSVIPGNNSNNSRPLDDSVRPISCFSDESQYRHPDLEEEDEEDEDHFHKNHNHNQHYYYHHHNQQQQQHLSFITQHEQQQQNRPSLDRQTSTASSSSGLGITINRYRGGLAPQVPPSSYHPASQK